MVELPEMRVLGYHVTRPHLRLLHLPEEEIEPSPVPLNTPDTALDDGFARDGWLLFLAFAEPWGVPVPLEGKAFRIGDWWDCVPAVNPRTVWLANPVGPDPVEEIDPDEPTVLVEYDGVRREELIRTELPRAFGLEAAVSNGLVLETPKLDGRGPDILHLWPYGGKEVTELAPGWWVVASNHSVLAVLHRNGDLALVDSGDGSETLVLNPLPGAWDRSGSFSPDGRALAIAVAAEDRRGRLAEAARTHRLALVNTTSGNVTLADGGFENFATAPVWSADGRWLIFEAPFDKSCFACDTHASPPRLIPIVRRRGRPGPLIDVTAITD